jgi:hypothetical protein
VTNWAIVTRTVVILDTRSSSLATHHAWRGVVETTTLMRVKVRWTQERVEHIGTRSDRYPDAIDIEVEWTDEAVADPRVMFRGPDPKSHTGAIRIVGYSPAAGFVVTVIAVRIDDELWGVTAWKTTSAERRSYQEAHDDNEIRS